MNTICSYCSVSRIIKSKSISFFLILIVSIFHSTGLAFSQSDSCYTAIMIKKGCIPKANCALAGAYNPCGFYLYRNCLYNIELKNKTQINGRLIDIRPDTLCFTNFINLNAAKKAHRKFDTLKVSLNELWRLNLNSDATFGFYERHYFKNNILIIRKDTGINYIESEWTVSGTNPVYKTELVPYLSANGLYLVYEQNGLTCFYQGGAIDKPDTSKMDRSYKKRNLIWFTPCSVEEINGLAFGMYTKNMKNRDFGERDTLLVRGLALEINLFALFSLMNPKLNGPFPDSIAYFNQTLSKDWQVKVNGVNISILNTINEMTIRGLSFSSAVTVVDRIYGISVSGVNNFCYVLKGVELAGLRNRAGVARGVQIGLFNKATDLRGIQIGLWNTNGKRSLPFINWQFSSLINARKIRRSEYL
ncbi:MAG: hypothetical protein V2A54_01165 [Bacteroidota bacterium]